VKKQAKGSAATMDRTTLLKGDCLDLLPTLKSESIDLVLSDIPYGISLDEWDVLHENTNSALGGQSPAQKKLGTGFKRRGKPINGWSKADLDRPREYQNWCESWATPLYQLLKPGASMFIFGGRRTIHRAILGMENAGFLLRDMLAWQKPNAHFRAQSLSKLFLRRKMQDAAEQWSGWRLGNLAPLFEPVAWLFKPYTIGGTIADNVLAYGVGAMNVDACLQDGKCPSNILRFDFESGERGHHEAQKPVKMLEYLIRLTTTEDQVVLDPFCGSGSTGVACVHTKRFFIGIDQDEEHYRTAKDRITNANLYAKPKKSATLS
jgi:site-specific DNA-methyltransferase (adenine-specific)